MNVPMPEDIDDFNSGPVYSWIFGKSRKKNKDVDAELRGLQRSSTPLLEDVLEES